MSRRIFKCLPIVLLIALANAGCSGGTTNVAGKVAYQGKPVVYGTVVIVGADGMPKSGEIQPDGTFRVSGVAVGKAKVAVSSPNPAPNPANARARGGRDQGGDEDKVPPPQAATAPPEVVKGWFAIPDQYGDPAKSTLEFEIQSGQPLNIELK